MIEPVLSGSEVRGISGVHQTNRKFIVNHDAYRWGMPHFGNLYVSDTDGNFF